MYVYMYINAHGTFSLISLQGGLHERQKLGTKLAGQRQIHLPAGTNFTSSFPTIKVFGQFF
jgi:hypothetical protein